MAGPFRVSSRAGPVGEAASSGESPWMLGAEDPLAYRQQSGELVPGCAGVPCLSDPAGKFAPGSQGIRMLSAEHSRHYGQQGSKLITRPGGVACLAGQPGQFAPGGQGVRVLSAEYPLHHVQQSGRLFSSLGRPLRQRQSHSSHLREQSHIRARRRAQGRWVDVSLRGAFVCRPTDPLSIQIRLQLGRAIARLRHAGPLPDCHGTWPQPGMPCPADTGSGRDAWRP